MKLTISMVTVLALAVLALPALAQDGQTIEYGQTVTGEITDESFEIPYVFTGSAGDLIVIEMSVADMLGDLDSPVVVLLDPESNELGSGNDLMGKIVFAIELPANGQYTILATRTDGSEGDSVGEFILGLHNPPILEIDAPVEDITSSDRVNYYAVKTTGSFDILYEKLSGEFDPAVTVHAISSSHEIEEIATLEGMLLSRGMIGIEGVSSIVTNTYIVTVAKSPFDFSLDEVTADFSITLSQ